MPVTVKKILKLDIFKSVEGIAGETGLNKIIKRVSVIDCPVDEELLDNNIVVQGDFFISNFFVVKDSVDDMVKMVKFLVQSKSSGICILNQYIDKLPKEVVDVANENSYPIFLIDMDIPYADIIRDIMEVIIQNKEDTINEMKIDNILNLEKDENQIERIAYEINNNFIENIATIYIKDFPYDRKNHYFIEDINSIKYYSALKYRNGILIILSFDKNNKKHINNQFNSIIKQFRSIHEESIIGISNTYNKLGKLRNCIIESLVSCNFSEIFNRNIVYYKELGIYKLLALLTDKVELEEFYNKIILPLKKYDEKYNSDLLETAIKFIANDGDYKKIANAMFQHENTIRYRITKIKQILDMEDKNIEFYSQLYIAIKIHIILTTIKNVEILHK
ncbi:PucR family transcriptional regulator [Wukongibacter baidiensis]|uniref:PucR family transcriptional regulator n=1 Tax=Wukongibacter baidiensis TaxID=1723361 RepID=UPI003D7FC78B